MKVRVLRSAMVGLAGGALAAASVQADEILSGHTNPGTFAPVASTPGIWDGPRGTDELLSGTPNPGEFDRVRTTCASPAPSRRAFDWLFSGVRNPTESTKPEGSATTGASSPRPAR